MSLTNSVESQDALVMLDDPNNHMYWQVLVVELMQCIPPIRPANPPKEDNLADRFVRHNPKAYSECFDPIVLEEWIRSMENIFAMIEVPKEKKRLTLRYFI